MRNNLWSLSALFLIGAGLQSIQVAHSRWFEPTPSVFQWYRPLNSNGMIHGTIAVGEMDPDYM